jgi:AcrR family transcriptional regulator
MPVKDCKTEQLLLETAMNIFYKEGRIKATTQEIADSAGVNRTLIHYYFKSRNDLLKKVNILADARYRRALDDIYVAEMPFKPKIRLIIEALIKIHKEYPYLELYLSSGMVRLATASPNEIKVVKESYFAFNHIVKEVESELLLGTIKSTSAMHFMTNILSLAVYPFFMRPLQLKLYEIQDNEYDVFIGERCDEIMRLLFNEK